ncbi:MAG: translation initiation inhibitor [Verrucomicrobia bacterium]|jgi:enamine deaminase RidA (YjgF/YER057c/UK114 family)|nr:translation initiation inhibitor [Verrucomicrobiota bacterium]
MQRTKLDGSLNPQMKVSLDAMGNNDSATIHKALGGPVDIVTVERPGYDKHFLTVQPASPDPHTMFDSVADFIREKKAHIVSQFVFGGAELSGRGVPEAERINGHRDWPVTWIHGEGPSGMAFSGAQATAVTGDVQTLVIGGQTVGSVYEDRYARYCRLGNLHAPDVTQSRERQTEETFDLMCTALAKADMTFDHVVRTWLYMDRILEWYDEFNAVRTAFFEKHNVFDGLVPASTGIGVANSSKAAMVADVLAVQPKTPDVKIEMVDSPLQGAAWEYGSSFSRGVEVAVPDCRKLYISGSASITPDGATAHVGDVEKQIALTMEVVAAILEGRGMTWSDTSRSIAYFKDIKNAPLYHAYCQRQNLPHFPVSLAHADVCRDDLLFELELDAVKVMTIPMVSS